MPSVDLPAYMLHNSPSARITRPSRLDTLGSLCTITCAPRWRLLCLAACTGRALSLLCTATSRLVLLLLVRCLLLRFLGVADWAGASLHVCKLVGVRLLLLRVRVLRQRSVGRLARTAAGALVLVKEGRGRGARRGAA